MNATEFWSRMRGLFQPLFGSPPPQAPPPPQHRPFEELLEELDRLREDALLDASKRQTEARLEEERRVQKEELDRHRADMWADILKMHGRLRTHMTEVQMQALAAELKEHCHEFRQLKHDHLGQMVSYAVSQRFHREALRAGWDHLLGRMAENEVSWPDPDVFPDELEHSRQMRLNYNREHFLNGPFGRFSDMMFGIVPAWRTVYPEKGGVVWRETVLLAVGGALAARAHHRITEEAHRRAEDLEQALTRQLTPAVKEIESRLTAGVQSLATARSLSDEAVSLCQERAPDIIWSELCRPASGLLLTPS